MKIKKQPDLARLITDLDKGNEGTGNQLNYTHATSISWKVIQGYKDGLSKRNIIKYVIMSLPVLHIQTSDGNARKSKFSHDQIQRTISVLDEMLSWYWWPFSKIRKDLKRVCKKS